MLKQPARRIILPLLAFSLLAATTWAPAQAADAQSPAIHFQVRQGSERLEMTVNESRILTLDEKIWKAQVNNQDLLEQTPLSPTQLQVFAKKPGVTQVNLFTEDDRVFTIDVIVYGDAKELEALLNAQFPNATLKVVPVASNVLISGYVDQPEHARLITRIAEEYYPKVIDNMTVSGVQQVLLHVKVLEVSRTKLRSLGFDWTAISGTNVIQSGVGAFLSAATGPTFSFEVIDGGDSFLGVLDALRKDSLVKVLAEPNLVGVSGRPSFFNAGGKYPYIAGVDNNGRVQIGWQDYGTRIDFVPIVLGNGRIRLEVRPSISEIDRSLQVETTPGLKERVVDTGVEMKAGQTLAIAGLVQNRVESENKGLPLVSEVPYVGTLFRRVEEKNNEIELLILVTPEFVDAMDAHEVPQCGPGMQTTEPDDYDLFLKGHLEVPNCCPPGYETYSAPTSGMMMPQEGMMIEQPMASTTATRAGGVVPNLSQNQYNPPNPPVRTVETVPVAGKTSPALIGPIGYDVLN